MKARWKVFWITLFMGISFIEAENDLKNRRFEKESSLHEPKPLMEIPHPLNKTGGISLSHPESTNPDNMEPVILSNYTRHEKWTLESPSITISTERTWISGTMLKLLFIIFLAWFLLAIAFAICSCCLKKTNTEESKPEVVAASPPEVMAVELNVSPYAHLSGSYSQQPGPPYLHQSGPYPQQPGPHPLGTYSQQPRHPYPHLSGPYPQQSGPHQSGPYPQ